MITRRISISQRLAAVGAATALMLGGAVTIGASQASAASSALFTTLAKCQAAKPLYNTSFTRISQDCTYQRALFVQPVTGLPISGYYLKYESR